MLFHLSKHVTKSLSSSSSSLSSSSLIRSGRHHRSLATLTSQVVSEKCDVPTHWYNIQGDLPVPLPPPLHPGELRPCGPEDFAPLFPMSLIAQEVSTERYIDIPEPVREVLSLWRPSPLFRAKRWEQALGLPSDVKIFYKYEGGSPSGSHKTNTAVPQVYFNKEAGTQKITTETGAGQWGSALAWSGNQFGDMDIEVYQVKVSYEQKPYRKAFIETCKGATIYPSPSTKTQYGTSLLEKDPENPGSLGIAISEAIEACVTSENAKYSLGSVLNHVLMHQTVIGLEAIEQMEEAGEYPDVVVGCTGGGSNFAGICFPFMGQKLRGEKEGTRFVAVEPAACPSLTKGKYAYDFGDTAQMTPLIKAHTLGASFIPPKVHSGGLRYHAMAPMISHLKELDELEARAVKQTDAFNAGNSFFQAEGILPAPEATHAIEGALVEAMDAKDKGESRTILFNMCGHGHFDMFAWQKFAAGEIEDFDYPDELVEEALKEVPGLNGVDWPMEK